MKPLPKIKPCPVTGQPGVMQDGIAGYWIHNEGGYGSEWAVNGPFARTKRKAIEAWNRRGKCS